MQRLAIYDMDKTITRRATWTPFLNAWIRARPWRAPMLLAGLVPTALYGMKAIDRARLKHATQRLVMGRRPDAAHVTSTAERFAARVVERDVHPQALARIAADRAAGYRVVLATASFAFYVEAIAAQLGIADVIATRSRAAADGLLAGIDGENCYGDAKLRMIEAWLVAEGIARGDAQVRFYSDHVSDAPALEWADEPFAVNPHGKLRRLAEERGWAVLDWR